MSRKFNTTGPCDPTRHYTVMREALIDTGRAKVAEGEFFTLFAPRQSGKTTYFQLLLARLNQEGYTAIWLSFEALKTATRAEFYRGLTLRLQRRLAEHGLNMPLTIESSVTLGDFFSAVPTQKMVLIIDEFEGIPDELLSEVMHTFREIYHQKADYALHSLLLVGVSTIADLVVGPASPFNIAAQLEIPYFSPAEVTELVEQYVSETGQPFDEAVIRAIYENTQGQPGLVCALCQHLVSQSVTDTRQPITMSDFYLTLRHFLTERAYHNLMNIVQKAKQRRSFMLKLLFQPSAIPFSVYDEDMAWLQANGVVENIDGYAEVAVPLYKKVLVTAFRPTINGEAEHYLTSARDVLGDYVTADGSRLNLSALLESYRAYVQRRGFRAFDTETLREGAWHYSLDGYLSFFIERLGGQTFVEVPSGRGRTDILIRYREQSYIIEVKVFSDKSYFKAGKGQLLAYLKSEGLAEGYYVVFSKVHTEADTLYTCEPFEGKRIHTYIIRTQFERPSEVGPPEDLE